MRLLNKLENKHIFVYGYLSVQTIYIHKIEGTHIHTEVRSLIFLKLKKLIPTTMFMKRNCIKLSYNKQYRTTYCNTFETRVAIALGVPETMRFSLAGLSYVEPIVV